MSCEPSKGTELIFLATANLVAVEALPSREPPVILPMLSTERGLIIQWPSFRVLVWMMRLSAGVGILFCFVVISDCNVAMSPVAIDKTLDTFAISPVFNATCGWSMAMAAVAAVSSAELR